MMFIEVAVNIPSDKTFTYSIPESLKTSVVPGKRVLIPFGKRRLTGYVLGETSATNRDDVKEILDILDHEPLFHNEDLKFYRWLSRYYLYPLGKTLHEILTGGIHLKSNTWVSLVTETSEGMDYMPSSSQQRILDALNRSPGILPLGILRKQLGKKDIGRDVSSLQKMGMIALEERMAKPGVTLKKEKIIALGHEPPEDARMTKKQRALIEFLRLHGPSPISTLRRAFANIPSTITALEQRGMVIVSEKEVYRGHGQRVITKEDDRRITLNEDQESALKEITKGLDRNTFFPCLLHGVTGSGKTEVYLSAIRECLVREGGAICLVPEIALTPQLMTRFNARFPTEEIAILHSGITKSSRYDQWRRIRRGETRVVIGARSAIFAPVKNLKLIIVDEEHDTSYKQEERMRYNARDIAIMKAQLHHATVILGSATPAIHTYYNTIKGKYSYLTLPRRTEDRPLPVVEIVDMKQEKKVEDKETPLIFSRMLREAIRDTIKKGQQVLLFLNRRGFHTFMVCQRCGYVFTCLNCAVSLTYHAGRGTMKCHYCDFSIKTPSECPSCHGDRIRSYGVGTERLEEEVRRLFPDVRVARMDSDTASKKGAYERIIDALRRREIDVLVGTQMITKGHDFPDITLVGVISADTSLNIPDFRASERTFQLLTQVAGRGGRGKAPGRVIIQTFNPDHYALIKAKSHDYLGFYGNEINLRRGMAYPPFSRIVNLHVSSSRESRGMEGIEKMKLIIRELSYDAIREGKIEIVGPAEAPIHKLKGKYRWQLLIKGKDSRILHRLVRNILEKAHTTGLDIKADIDPLNFM